ncbi:MAG: hypothetical protein AAFX78_03550 [Cyanobacteria bacterium J06638_20]
MSAGFVGIEPKSLGFIGIIPAGLIPLTPSTVLLYQVLPRPIAVAELTEPYLQALAQARTAIVEPTGTITVISLNRISKR